MPSSRRDDQKKSSAPAGKQKPKAKSELPSGELDKVTGGMAIGNHPSIIGNRGEFTE